MKLIEFTYNAKLNSGLLYEISSCLATSGTGKKDQIFSEPLPVPFRHMFMHQCSDPITHMWKWGMLVQNIVFSDMKKSGMIDRKTEKHYVGASGGEYEAEPLICFEDIYLSPRVGTWIQSPHNHINFRKAVAHETGAPGVALAKPGESVDRTALPKG